VIDIDVRQLTKRYGPTLAVDGLSFAVTPGRVTGFLGPNGAGKSTTMRIILGLDRPDHGHALIDGRPYARLPEPPPGPQGLGEPRHRRRPPRRAPRPPPPRRVTRATRQPS
jgi:ABC-type branched-subunit amino acid transport system ATPase component